MLAEFGYYNPRYFETKSGKELLEKITPITDRQVEEFIKYCKGLI
jgi:hypothetical protein